MEKLNYEFDCHVLLFLIHSSKRKISDKSLIYLLYLCEQWHLKTYGCSMTEFTYYANTHGPMVNDYNDIITYTNTISAIDLDCISESEIESIVYVVNKYNKLSEKELALKCKGQAWLNAYESDTASISYIDMAKEINATDSCLYTIRTRQLNDEFIAKFRNQLV